MRRKVLVLAVGQVAAGHPWAGVYASVAVMCALLCWMLQGWLPAEWALLGGLLGVLRLGLFGYWINSYWGGAVAAIGGLLVLGAMPRLLRRIRVRDALFLAGGMAILANSRPYEGLLLSFPVCVWLAVRLLGRAWSRVGKGGACGWWCRPALVLAVAAAGTCYYYWRVTGNPFRMPYQVARDQYATARIYLWEQPLPVPAYRHQQMRDFYAGWELTKFLEAKSLGGLAWNTLGKAGAFWMFFLGPALTLPLLFGWRLFGDRRVRPLVVIGGISVGGLALNTWFYAHYAAPMTGLIYVLVLQGLRHVRTWRSEGFRGGSRHCPRGPGGLPGDGAVTRVRPASQSLYAAGLADDLVLHAAGQCGARAHSGEIGESTGPPPGDRTLPAESRLLRGVGVQPGVDRCRPGGVGPRDGRLRAIAS